MSYKKGSAFERYVCKFLSVWLTGKEKPYQYWRMPLSGGLATIDELNADLSGDIRALTSEAEILTNIYSIELKTGYPKTSFWQLFKGIKNFPIELFWNQCVRDATKAGKLPMLIYRKKGNKPIVGITNSCIFWETMNISNITLKFGSDKGLPDIQFYDMEQFFQVVTPELLETTTMEER